MGKAGIVTGYAFLFAGIVYFYYNSPQFKTNFDYTNEFLEGWNIPFYGINFSVLDFAGSLLCCLRYRSEFKTEKSWLEVLLSVTLFQFGGTTIAGILTGQTPSWMMSTSAFPSLVLAWWLVFNYPLDLFYTWLKTPLGSVILFFAGLLASISAAHAVGSWGMDKAMFNDFHTNAGSMWKSWVICIAAGSLAASGGGLIADAFGFFSAEPNKGMTLSTTSNLFSTTRFDVSASINRAFWLAIFYYFFLQRGADLTQAPESFLSNRVEGHSLLSIVYIVLYLLQRQVDFDPFQILTRAALLLSYTTTVVNPYYYDK